MRKPSPAQLADVVRRQLTDDLRRAPYKGNENPMAGHCYVASEALYHLLGGKQSPWVPQYVHHEGSPHWFLKHKGTGEVLDATSEQFKTKVPYHASVGKGFLTRDPSARARTVIQAVHAAMPGQLAKAERDLKQVASIAAFNADGMLLFGRRNDNGKWTLPGGHFEPGEDKSKAAVRELYEETGLTPVGMRYLGSKPGGRNGEVLVHAFAASVKGEVSFQHDPDQEFAEAKWVNPQAIPSEVMDNLHNPKNVTLQLLGIQEDLVKAEGDMPKPPEPPKPEAQSPSEEETAHLNDAIANAHAFDAQDKLFGFVSHPHAPTAHAALDAIVGQLEKAPKRNAPMLLNAVILSPHTTDEHIVRAHNAVQGTVNEEAVIERAKRLPLSLQHSIAQKGKQIGSLIRRNWDGTSRNFEAAHPEVLKALLKMPGLGNESNAKMLARHFGLGEEGVRLAFENPKMRSYVLQRPDVPNDLRKLGIEHGHANAVFNDLSSGVSNDVIEHAINHSDDSRNALARWINHGEGNNAKMTEDQTRRFLLLANGDQLRYFGDASRRHLQRHFSKPENIEHFLVNMKDDMYRPLAGPAHFRTRLEEDPELAYKLLWGANSKHPNREHVAELLSGTQDKALLDKMLKDHDPNVVSAALGSKKLTPEQLEPFVNKPEHFFQLSIHPGTTDDQFNRVMANYDKMSGPEKKSLLAFGAGVHPAVEELDRKLAQNPPESRDAVRRMAYAQNQELAFAHRLTPEHLDKMIQPGMPIIKLRDLLHHPRISEETLSRVAATPEFDEFDPRLRPKARAILSERNPDIGFGKKVAVKLGTSKLRQIRDAILESGRPTAHKKEFADKGVDLTPFTIPGTANVSAEKIQQHIDNLQPHATYNVSEDVWDGGQRHSDDNSKVFQLNLTKDLINKMKQEGVYDTFQQMHQASRSSGHPVHEKHGLGWVRYTQGSAPLSDDPNDLDNPKGTTPDKDHFFIDEIQSDFGQDFARNILTNTVNHYRQEGENQGLEGEELEDYVREREAETAREIGARYPQEHVEKINNILFGGKYANEVLAEAFLQHLRDEGHAGSEVRIHHANTKAPLSNLQVRDDGSPHKKWIDTKNGNKTKWREADDGEPDEAQKQAFLADGIKPVDDIPRVHMETYGTMPKKVLGMRPTTYGELATESNRRLRGKPTWGDKLHKAEHFSDHYNYEDEPALHQPEDEIDRMLKHPDPTERRLASKHPGVTEDHLIRLLHSSGKPLSIEKMLQHPEAKDRFQNFAYGYFTSPQGHSANGRSALVRNSDSKPLLDWLAKNDIRDLDALFRNPNTTDEHKLTVLRRKDLQEPGEFVSLNDADVTLSPEVLNEYVKYALAHPNGSLPYHVVNSPKLSDETLDKLATSDDFDIAAGNPNFKLEHALKAAPRANERFIRTLHAWHPEYLEDPQLSRHLLSGSTVDDAIYHGVGSPEQLLDIARHAQDYGTIDSVLRSPKATIDHLNTALNQNTNVERVRRQDLASTFLERKNLSGEDVVGALQHIHLPYVWGPAYKRHADKLSPEQNAQLMDKVPQGLKGLFFGNANLSKEGQLKLVDSGDAEAIRGLMANKHLHPEAIDRVLDQPTPDPKAVQEIVAHPQFTDAHYQKLLGKNLLGNESVAAYLAGRSSNPEHVQAALARHPNSREVHAKALNNKNVQLPHDILHRAIDIDKDAMEPDMMRSAIAKLPAEHHVALAEHKHKEVRHALAEITRNPEALSKLVKDKAKHVKLAAIYNKNVPLEALESVAKDRNTPLDTRAYIARALKPLRPDSQHKETVQVKFDTNKARKLRDLILSLGKLEMRHKDLGNLAQGVKYGVNPKNGNLSAELLQQYIDGQPTARYNVSHDKWDGIQRHNDEKSKVFQLNLTDEHVRQMRQAGVYGTFLKLQDQFTNSHPLKDHSIGWVRYTGKTRGKGKGLFIDEVQSDHTVPIAEKARTQKYRHKMDRSQMNAEEDHRIYKDEWDLYGAKGQPAPVDADEQTKARVQHVRDLYQKSHSEATESAQRAFEKANEDYPADHQKKINQILFGGKHSSEVLMEAFHQHLRDKGHIGVPVAIHSVHSKAAENLSDLETDADGKVDLSKVPGHYQKGYKQVPEAMQMEPAQYSADNMATQDNPEHQGKQTYQHPLRKKTE